MAISVTLINHRLPFTANLIAFVEALLWFDYILSGEIIYAFLSTYSNENISWWRTCLNLVYNVGKKWCLPDHRIVLKKTLFYSLTKEKFSLLSHSCIVNAKNKSDVYTSMSSSTNHILHIVFFLIQYVMSMTTCCYYFFTDLVLLMAAWTYFSDCKTVECTFIWMFESIKNVFKNVQMSWSLPVLFSIFYNQ